MDNLSDMDNLPGREIVHVRAIADDPCRRIGTRQAAAVADVGEECRISDREPSDAELSPAGAFAQFFEDAIFAAPRLLERILDRVRDAMAVGRGPFALRIVERRSAAHTSELQSI